MKTFRKRVEIWKIMEYTKNVPVCTAVFNLAFYNLTVYKAVY